MGRPYWLPKEESSVAKTQIETHSLGSLNKRTEFGTITTVTENAEKEKARGGNPKFVYK